MRNFLIFTILLFVFSGVSAQRKKVAVVLSGGGAKGIAHVGALKVIEEAGIPIDYVVGTSMGSIVGGLYSIGYDAAMLDSMVRTQDWSFLLSDGVPRKYLSLPEREKADKYLVSFPFAKDKNKRIPAGLIRGQNLGVLFANLAIGYEDSDFSRFPIPFACVASDVVNGKKVILDKGSLPEAMRSSMAIPGVFIPVRKDSMLLVDGGIVDNFPTDIAKERGADIIIGVDVQSGYKTIDELHSVTDILGQIVDFFSVDEYDQNVKLATVHIHPDLKGYTAADFNPVDVDTFLVRGERAAREKWDDLLAVRRQLGLPDKITPAPYKKYILRDTIPVGTITFTGSSPKDERRFMREGRLEPDSNLVLPHLDRAVSVLYGTKAYADIDYRFIGGPRYNNLQVTMKDNPQSQFNFGLRFDTQELASVLLNAAVSLDTKYSSQVSLTGRINVCPYVRLEYSVENNYMKQFNIAYQFQYNDIDIYTHGTKTQNVTFRRQTAEIGMADVHWLNFMYQVGVRFEYFNRRSFLYADDEGVFGDNGAKGLFSYYASLRYETYDDSYFPTAGMSLHAGYSLYTDNMATYDGHTPFSALNASYGIAVPLTERLALLPTLYGRVLIGHYVANPYLNAVGGTYFGRYLPQQIPFAGINNVELLGNSVMVLKLAVRYRFGSKHYATLTFNGGAHDDDFFDLLDGHYLWGGSAGYAYNSRFGPLEAVFGVSNRTKKLEVYAGLGYTF
ncbi:MAG: patatin-like phospholipase family protein [Parabacteroides sp.]|nr:patatin-like phospholipase family protein [Parabacteroides sp.]